VPYAYLADVRLHYERAGSGEPELLFVPGEVPEQVNAMIERFLATSL
jgi:hypothetical protein